MKATDLGLRNSLFFITVRYQTSIVNQRFTVYRHCEAIASRQSEKICPKKRPEKPKNQPKHTPVSVLFSRPDSRVPRKPLNWFWPAKWSIKAVSSRSKPSFLAPPICGMAVPSGVSNKGQASAAPGPATPTNRRHRRWRTGPRGLRHASRNSRSWVCARRSSMQISLPVSPALRKEGMVEWWNGGIMEWWKVEWWILET